MRRFRRVVRDRHAGALRDVPPAVINPPARSDYHEPLAEGTAPMGAIATSTLRTAGAHLLAPQSRAAPSSLERVALLVGVVECYFRSHSQIEWRALGAIGRPACGLWDRPKSFFSDSERLRVGSVSATRAGPSATQPKARQPAACRWKHGAMSRPAAIIKPRRRMECAGGQEKAEGSCVIEPYSESRPSH